MRCAAADGRTSTAYGLQARRAAAGCTPHRREALWCGACCFPRLGFPPWTPFSPCFARTLRRALRGGAPFFKEFRQGGKPIPAPATSASAGGNSTAFFSLGGRPPRRVPATTPPLSPLAPRPPPGRARWSVRKRLVTFSSSHASGPSWTADSGCQAVLPAASVCRKARLHNAPYWFAAACSRQSAGHAAARIAQDARSGRGPCPDMGNPDRRCYAFAAIR